MKTETIKRAWREHPVLDGIATGGVAFIASAVFIGFSPPAWALQIPLGGGVVIDLGSVPPWVGAFIFVVTWWEARKARKNAEVAAATAKTVSIQIDGMLKDRDAAKVREGEAKEKKVGVAAAEQLAEGQRQGRDAERESVAAKTGGAAPAHADDKQPLPVADDRTGKASDRVAAATERLADATEVKKPE